MWPVVPGRAGPGRAGPGFGPAPREMAAKVRQLGKDMRPCVGPLVSPVRTMDRGAGCPGGPGGSIIPGHHTGRAAPGKNGTASLGAGPNHALGGETATFWKNGSRPVVSSLRHPVVEFGTTNTTYA